MDSEDEEWLNQHAAKGEVPLTNLQFEEMMDRLEKVSISGGSGRPQFTMSFLGYNAVHHPSPCLFFSPLLSATFTLRLQHAIQYTNFLLFNTTPNNLSKLN